ncbi:hypothetical protein W97_03729 [Coniosporium apollinis CBS 100218]|uniref:Ubiquitin carboxyl-terminal hydrolase 19 n=1 Tax=Coniosporium apollinis (strain CBS 100218) TaxID=1168221 RepID=R7YRG2_CONA1|nr:uncharacterized protein W97_03729 [Coniosporium apollinis CBS 100218]EON64497.1 hypothetical protein W97_03729 [Coniosporium apollinis CBS 100218]
MLVMDPQTAAFTPRDELWRIQSDMLRVHQTQSDHAERLSRLERRQEEDVRLKSVWGSSSPFPSVLGGTPQHGPIQQPTADAFSGFDDQQSTLIGSLHLDADDEPRRIGASSRANSVRFDESANQGHWAHASRTSVDLIPRTGSGLGGHAMIERTYSHKSDGRQSSAGQSVHSATSGRANSLGLDTAFGVQSAPSPMDVPGLAPGLFILGSVPSIIRCWLSTKFKHDTLLYAAVCTGSYTSFIDIRLVDHLGFRDQVTRETDGNRRIKLAMYLPEAVPHPASSRSNSPAPQLPSLTVDFTVVDRTGADGDSKAIQVFIGSDMLRAHSADILFSSNTLTLFDDDRSKLSIPLVRPEDDRTFKSLYITSGPVPSESALKGLGQTPEPPSAVEDTVRPEEILPSAPAIVPEWRTSSPAVRDLPSPKSEAEPSVAQTRSAASEISQVDLPSRRNLDHRPLLGPLHTKAEAKDNAESSSTSNTLSRSGSSPAIWSNWRRDDSKPNASTGAGYQRRDQGIKVLKPVRSTSRVLSGGTGSPASGQSRFFDDGRRRTSVVSANEAGDAQTKLGVVGDKAKENGAATNKPRPTNVIGSAFPWLNSGGQSK